MINDPKHIPGIMSPLPLVDEVMNPIPIVDRFNEDLPIIIEVRGGVIVDVKNVPFGYRYKILDWDNYETFSY